MISRYEPFLAGGAAVMVAEAPAALGVLAALAARGPVAETGAASSSGRFLNPLLGAGRILSPRGADTTLSIDEDCFCDTFCVTGDAYGPRFRIFVGPA